MRFSTILAVILPFGAALAQTNHVVQVGANGTLTFTPNQLQVQNGDSVSFQFLSKNHTVTQSSFAAPCTNLTNADGSSGIDSGFQFVPAGTTSFQQWTFTVNNASSPLWFYCRQKTPASHCGMGMVFAINPTAAKSYAAFQQAAMATLNSTATPSASSAGGTSPTASSGISGSSPSATDSPSASANGASAIRAGSAAGVLLTGVALIAGLVL